MDHVRLGKIGVQLEAAADLREGAVQVERPHLCHREQQPGFGRVRARHDPLENVEPAFLVVLAQIRGTELVSDAKVVGPDVGYRVEHCGDFRVFAQPADGAGP